MASPSCLLISVGGRRSQRPEPSPTLGSLGPSHQRRHKSRVSLRGPPCAQGVSGTPYGEVRDTVAFLTHWPPSPLSNPLFGPSNLQPRLHVLVGPTAFLFRGPTSTG